MGQINFDLNFWTVTFLVFNFVLTLFNSISNRSKAADDELKATKKGLDEKIAKVSIDVNTCGHRLAKVESAIENGITKADISAVYRRINDMAKTVGPIEGKLEEMSKSMTLVHKELLELLKIQRKG